MRARLRRSRRAHARHPNPYRSALSSPRSFSLYHPVAFWLGCAAIIGGVLAHGPMFLMGRYTHYQMVGMEMDLPMLVGMALIPLGVALSAYGLFPRIDQLRRAAAGLPPPAFDRADAAALNAEHWKLVLVLVVALAVDVLKPATLGFVMPGMTREYGISKETGGLLALVALTGTTVGSVVWGRLADVFGRRSAILLSALMFIGTAICGAMPDFGWNLLMCFLMGASAGGLLPIAFTLMAETVPAAHRGWLLVALGGVGTSAGYLLAALAADLLVPLFSWRSLWLLGLPTGLLIIFLGRCIPESPRFLANAGLPAAAQAVLDRFAGPAGAGPAAAPADDEAAAAPAASASLLRGAHAPLSWALIAAGLAWGLVNFGFLLWLPTSLGTMGMAPEQANALLARSALVALPGTALVIWLYHRWSSVKALMLFLAMTCASLLVLAVLGLGTAASAPALIAASALLLLSASGVIAMLIPYAAEIYPVHLRGTGSGLIAASSKAGGILGAAGGVAGLFAHVTLSALVVAVPLALAVALLLRSGVETRGRRLEDIQAEIRA